MRSVSRSSLLLLLTIALAGPVSGRYVITNQWSTVAAFSGYTVTLDSSVALPPAIAPQLRLSVPVSFSPGPLAGFSTYFLQNDGNLVGYCWGTLDSFNNCNQVQIVIEPIAWDVEGRVIDFIVLVGYDYQCANVTLPPFALTVDGVTYEAAYPCELSATGGPTSGEAEGGGPVYSSTDTGALEFVGGALVNPQNYLGVSNGADHGWTIKTPSKMKSIQTVALTGAETVAVGPNANGTTTGDPWALGSTDISGGHPIYHWEQGEWALKPGAAVNIAVSPQGDPWIIDAAQHVWYWNGSAFQRDTAAPCATWIGVGPNAYGLRYGDPWIVGCGTALGGGGHSIYERQNSAWFDQSLHSCGFECQEIFNAVRIAVSPQGYPWIVNSSGGVAYWNGTTFVSDTSAPCASSIAVGPAVATLSMSNYNLSSFAPPEPFRFGQAWILGCTADANGNYPIFQLENEQAAGIAWVQVGVNQPNVPFSMGSQLSVTPDRGIPWIFTASGTIYP